MIGRIMTPSTSAAVKMLPPPDSETLPSANSGNHPSLSLRNLVDRLELRGQDENSPQPEDDRWDCGEKVDDTSRRSVRQLRGAYIVMNNAMNTATGTARMSATIELMSVTTSRSRIPNLRFCASLVSNSALVRKLTWSARSEGMACTRRKIAIRMISTMIDTAEAVDSLGRWSRHGVDSATCSIAWHPSRRGGPRCNDVRLTHALASSPRRRRSRPEPPGERVARDGAPCSSAS